MQLEDSSSVTRGRERFFTYPVKSHDGATLLGPESSWAPLHFWPSSMLSACRTESSGKLFSLETQRLLSRDCKAHYWPCFFFLRYEHHTLAETNKVLKFLICCSLKALWQWQTAIDCPQTHSPSKMREGVFPQKGPPKRRPSVIQLTIQLIPFQRWCKSSYLWDRGLEYLSLTEGKRHL